VLLVSSKLKFTNISKEKRSALKSTTKMKAQKKDSNQRRKKRDKEQENTHK